MIFAVVSARIAGLDRIKSGCTSRFANRLPIFGASRLPRSSNGRSLSGNAVSSQLDLAWRMRNSVFMPHPVRAGRPRPYISSSARCTCRRTARLSVVFVPAVQSHESMRACRVLHARGETRVPGVAHERHEVFLVHADQLLVVSRFKIDLRLIREAVVDNRGHSIGQPDWRDGPQLAVAE